MLAAQRDRRSPRYAVLGRIVNERLTWDDYEEIGLRLFEVFSDLDPLTVRFTDLHERVTELDGFDDDPQASSEGKLERIQMAWLEEWQEENG